MKFGANTQFFVFVYKNIKRVKAIKMCSRKTTHEKCKSDIEALLKRITELEDMEHTIEKEKLKYQVVLKYAIRLLMK